MKSISYIKQKRWLLIVSLFLFGINNIKAAETLVIETIYKAPLSTPDGKGLVDLITKERFARSGLNVTLQPIPNTQALEQANSGVFDGDIMRVSDATVAKKYPNLLQIPGTFYRFEFVVFTKNRDFKPTNGWNSLKAHRVAVPQGWILMDKNINESNTMSVERISSPPQLFSALHRGKVDAIIFERMMGYELVKTLGSKDIVAVEPPLDSQEMFLYLNKKHEALVPKLDDALKSMINDGTIKKLTDDFLSKYKN